MDPLGKQIQRKRSKYINIELIQADGPGQRYDIKYNIQKDRYWYDI